jgi:hypothetical protein
MEIQRRVNQTDARRFQMVFGVEVVSSLQLLISNNKLARLSTRDIHPLHIKISCAVVPVDFLPRLSSCKPIYNHLNCQLMTGPG